MVRHAGTRLAIIRAWIIDNADDDGGDQQPVTVAGRPAAPPACLPCDSLAAPRAAPDRTEPVRCDRNDNAFTQIP